ncbi:TetR/AcrR family transcriptional regulator [Bacillus massilinigeriensis]|uniref:TetR/AcrR family transcriptional regulator n=1 Tax=Bacillus mediterraneensis TaxID=1805474 RepID=UPI0008F845D5|nr:TetR/AcrR family transcriptional regulator [Bacillus mediterraneensis]
MFDKFHSIDEVKQERILSAAMREFAEQGYEKASTNAIVKAAGISKGLLFHYFRNKKELYLYLYDHFSDILKTELYEKIDWEEEDLLLKLRSVTLLKFGLVKKYPELFHFLRQIYEEKSPEVRHLLEERNNNMTEEAFSRLFATIDPNTFKEGIDIKAAINMIIWTIEGFGQELQRKVKGVPVDKISQEEVLQEMDIYLDLLKTALYK